MSLEADFTAEGMSVEDYLRLIWDETELNEDSLQELDVDYLDADELKKIVSDIIRNQREISSARKDFYYKLIQDYFREENCADVESFLRTVENRQASESEKREQIAQLMTRVLRGQLASSGTHRLPVEGFALLGQPIKPWRLLLDGLFRTERAI